MSDETLRRTLLRALGALPFAGVTARAQAPG